jgi:RNA polymerase sigma-70 factor (ECF subfamily)
MSLSWVTKDVSVTDLPSLIQRAQQGNREAFEAIVRLTARIVYAQVVATVRDRQKAEDLTQETFIAAWKAIGTLTAVSGFNSWLLTIARNTTLDALKAEQRLKRGGSAVAGEATDELADAGRSPEEKAQASEATSRALEMLEELPEDYRRPLMMRYLGGADYESIRRDLGISDGALRGLLNRGMAMLRERMTKQER